MIKKSPNDPRHYRSVQLDNGLTVLLIQQSDTPKSAAALAVRVGHFDDPPERQGLAHFLEHMLFLGTDRFPEPDAFPQFINQHGGRNNAWTGTEFTNYFFDIDPVHYSSALERFSRFFIAPLLSPEYVDKERHAVNSEYQLKLRDAVRRKYQVHKETVNPAHPFSKFSVGSLDTLEDRPEQSLHQAVTEFYRQHYSANLMRLVLHSPEPLDTMEQWARDCFSDIPDYQLCKQLPDIPLYLPEQLGVVIQIRPLKETRRLVLSFPFADQSPRHREKPLSFLAHLLGWEGDGSLLALLKRRGLVNSLSAGGGAGGYNFKDFTLTFGLTHEGVRHYDEIIGHLFEQLALLRQQGWQPALYQDRAQLSRLAFQFQEMSDAIDWSSHLAVSLHHYQPDEVLCADHLMEGMNEALYEEYLAQLCATRLRVTLISPEQETERTASWYHTEYALKALPGESLSRWDQARPHPEMRLPEANPWLCDNPQVWPIAQPSLLPRHWPERAGLSLWWLADNEFNVPRGYLNLAIHSTAASQSVAGQVAGRLLVDLLSDQLHQSLYAAEVAGFHYRLQCGLHGLGCQTSGYSQHQVELLGQVLQHLRQGEVSHHRFDALRQRLLSAWDNAAKERPLTCLFQSMAELLYHNRYNPAELAAELRLLTPEKLSQFAGSWHNTLHVEALAAGNWRQQDISQLSSEISSHLLSDSQPQSPCPPRITRLPAQGGLWQERSEHNDSALIWYWQAPGSEISHQALMAMASQLMGPVFFHQLRTEQQLGYQLGISYYPVSGHPGLIAYLQSPVASPLQAHQAFTVFFNDFAQGFETRFDESSWQQQKQALLTQLEAPDANLAMRTQRLWLSLQHGDSAFTHRQQLTDAIRQLSRHDFSDWLKAWLLTDLQHPIVLSSRGTAHQSTDPGDNAEDIGLTEIADLRAFREQQTVLPPLQS